jgi:cytoskeletal protein CcmA (bactofilin family)
MFGKSKRYRVGDIIEPLLDEERFAERQMLARMTERQMVEGSAVAHSEPLAAPETISSISSGLSIIGKIVGNGKVAIFGHVEGEIHASTVQLGDGAQIEGNIIAEELTIGGRVKGTIRANRVKLNSTAVVEGDIYHRSLAIEESAQFEGMSRRQENAVDIPSLVPAKFQQAETVSIKVHKQGDSAPDGLNPSQAGNGRGNGASDSPNS